MVKSTSHRQVKESLEDKNYPPYLEGQWQVDGTLDGVVEMGDFHKWGILKMVGLVYTGKSQSEMNDLGVPPFQETFKWVV